MRESEDTYLYDREPPKDGWRAIVSKARDVYWKARREGKDENDAIALVVDEILAPPSDN